MDCENCESTKDDDLTGTTGDKSEVDWSGRRWRNEPGSWLYWSFGLKTKPRRPNSENGSPLPTNWASLES